MKAFYFVPFSICFFSCQIKKDKSNKDNCAYTLTDFLNKNDSVRYDIVRRYNYTEVYDKFLDGMGYFQFDKNGILRAYSFLLNEKKNSYHFGIEYDRFGNQISKPKCTVVQWLASQKGNDSLLVSFYLYRINYSYGQLKLYNSAFSINVPLLNSKLYSDLVRGEAVVPYKNFHTYYFVSGTIRDNCSNQTDIFRDSTYF